MDVNDNAGCLNGRGVLAFFASRLAPTGFRGRLPRPGRLSGRPFSPHTFLVESPGQIIDRFPGELSGGQKQRICIARALAAEPKVIICDEVTSALDQTVAKGILQLLGRLQEQLGLSYLFITHDIETVKGIADQVVVMHQGRIVEQGPLAQVFSPPHQDYTARLLASVPEMDPDWLTRTLTGRVPATVRRFCRPRCSAQRWKAGCR